MHSRLTRSITVALGVLTLHAIAQAPKQPKLNDPALRLEALAVAPDIEAPTTVCSAPDGSFYVGCDPRDTRLNTEKPECYMVRYSSMGADKKRTVFADKIYSPAGSLWHDGWLYVTHDPLLTRFKDTDGDGVADVREDLVTSLGHLAYGGLNDHCVSGFTLGMDGFFYISVGDRGVYQAKGKDGKTLTMQGGGIIRCRPDGTDLQIFSTGTRNHLAVLLDAEDNAFTRDNTDDGNGWWTRLTHHIEGGYYGYPFDYQSAPNYGVTQPSQQTLDAMKHHGHEALATANPQFSTFLPAMADFGGGSPTGGVCYLSDGLPETYRGKLFFSEWGKGGIYVTEVARDGATFKLVKDEALVQSDKGVDFRPMQISTAPDGSLLIADWGWGGWKAPKREGTVWRLSWPGAKPAPRLKDESKASIDELIAALGHPDRDQRLRAKSALAQLLIEKLPPNGAGSSWFDDTNLKKVASIVADDEAPRQKRLTALWTLVPISRIEREILWRGVREQKSANLNGAKEVSSLIETSGEKANDAMVRGQAIRAAQAAGRISTGWFAERMLSDSDAAVRLIAATAMIARGELTAQLTKPLEDTDPWVRFATISALRRHLALGAPIVNGESIKTGAETLAPALISPVRLLQESAWQCLSSSLDAESIRAGGLPDLSKDLARLGDTALTLMSPISESKEPSLRSRALSVVARMAYQPTPWDGHWWGTQPVKNPQPPKTVPWEGTTKAVGQLAKALGDQDASVRLAAAKAFSEFILDPERQSALESVRKQLSVEKEMSVRRQLIESLGVQRDPGALDVFTKIALDSTADAEFRDAAIGAVANIGGDAAKKTMGQLASADLSPTALRKVIEAIGSMKIAEVAPQLVNRLHDPNISVRMAATKALGSLGAKSWPSGAADALIALLDEKDSKLVTTTIETLGNAKAREALPRFIELADKNKFRREAVSAMGSIADESAVPVLVKVLADKNTPIRRDSAKTLKRYRSTAMPLIEQAIASHQIPSEFVAEIRNYLDSGIIEKWKLIGPFENVWEAIHPPEKDALAAGGKPDLGHKYTNAEGQEVGWRDANASTEDSRVDLAKIFDSTGMVCAYAWAEIDAPEASDAKLRCGSDDQIAIWINGQKVHNVAATRGFQQDQDEVPVHFAAGKNQLLVKIGNLSGTWEFGVRLPGYADGKFVQPKDLPPEEKQRNFVLATKPDGAWANSGNAERGAKIFHDQTGPIGGICATCHTVRGKGGQIGPDLSAIGTNYRRPELLTSILEPSKTIALGFEQAIVETKGGDTFTGAQRQETNEALTLVGADAQPHVIKKSEIKSRKTLEQSLMPPGLTMALKPEDVADLLAYLESLRGQ